VICHAAGQLADDIPLHKASAANALVRSTATITSVTLPASGPLTPTIVFNVKDSSGNAVGGLTSFSFTVAQLVPAASGGITNWRSLINRNYNAASDVSVGGTTESSLPNATYPAAPHSTCTESPAGTYSCVLGNDLSVQGQLNPNYGVVTVVFDPSLPTRFALQSSAPMPGQAVTTVAATPPFDGAFDLDATQNPVPDIKAEVTTAACNACHQRLTEHGRRLSVPFCITCHNAYSYDNLLPTAQRNAPDPYNGTVDFKRVLHKVHMGKTLPSVIAGTPFLLHNIDFSDVAFPQMTSISTNDAGNCTVCHSLSSADPADPANAWKNKPGKVACASCHDNVSWDAVPPAGFIAHPGGPQADDTNCAGCHASGATQEPVDVVHTGLRALQNAASGKYKFTIVSVASGAPGQKPVITFSVTDPTNANAAYALTEPAWTKTATGDSRLGIDIAWSTRAVASAGDTNYTNEGSGSNPGQPISIDALKNKVTGSAPGTFTVTSTVAIPANAVGVGEVVLEGHPADVTVTPVVRIPVKSATKTFAITGTATTARRQVVDVNKCNVCHGALSAHGANRTGSIETCVACHNANATDISMRPKTGATVDGKAEESVDFKRLIHGIHGAGFAGTGPVIYGYGGTVNDFSAASFPGNDQCSASNPDSCLVNNCEICHFPNTYGASFAAANGSTTSTETLADPTTYQRTTKITAACSACHASSLYVDHMQQNGGHFGLTQAQIDALP